MSNLTKSLLVTASLLFLSLTPLASAQEGWAVNTPDWIFGDGSTPTPTATPQPSTSPAPSTSPNPNEPTPTPTTSPEPNTSNQPTPTLTVNPNTTITPTPQTTLPPTYTFPLANILIVGIAAAIIAFGFIVAKTRNQNHENN